MANKDFWLQEYAGKNDLPSSRTLEPSSGLKDFAIEANLKGPGIAVDLGAGNLRNSIFLASLGFSVEAIEWAENATELGMQVATERGLDNQIKVHNQDLSKPIPLGNESADIIIDMMVLHLLNETERNFIASEIRRVLKPGGHYLLFTIGAEGSEYEKLISENPGPEKGSYQFEHNGFDIIEKGFSVTEIETLFAGLRVESFEKKVTVSNAFGGQYERVYYFLVLSK